MAKTFSDGYLPVSFYADADLHAKQYYCVTAASTEDYVKTATAGSNPLPMGIQQDDVADTVGDAVSVKTFGFSKAVVAACAIAGTACLVKFGTLLTTGSDGKLYACATTGVAAARSFGTISSGSAIINVFFYGNIASCALAAS